MRISVVLDCQDPKALVPFWSAAMGYKPATSLPSFEVLVPEELYGAESERSLTEAVRRLGRPA